LYHLIILPLRCFYIFCFIIIHFFLIFVRANTQQYSTSLCHSLILFQLCGTPFKFAAVFVLFVTIFYKAVTPAELEQIKTTAILLHQKISRQKQQATASVAMLISKNTLCFQVLRKAILK